MIQTSAAINPGNSGGAHIATQLIGQGKVTSSHRAYLGVEVAATTSGGLLVTKVQPGGPAARTGIHEGELITAADGAATPDQASTSRLRSPPPTGPSRRCGSPSASSRAETTWKEAR